MRSKWQGYFEAWLNAYAEKFCAQQGISASEFLRLGSMDVLKKAYPKDESLRRLIEAEEIKAGNKNGRE